VTWTPLSRLKGQRSRSPGHFTHCCVKASVSCSGERGNVLTVRTYCYIAVGSVARGTSAPTEGGEGGILWRLTELVFYGTISRFTLNKTHLSGTNCQATITSISATGKSVPSYVHLCCRLKSILDLVSKTRLDHLQQLTTISCRRKYPSVKFM